jgi:hypothetical protein
MSASFSLGFRNGFGVDLELTPKQHAIGVSGEDEEDIYPLTIQAMQLRLPLLVLRRNETQDYTGCKGLCSPGLLSGLCSLVF